MDAMISRCVDEINLSEKQLLAQREGREAPIYSWDMRGEWEGTHCVAACCQGNPTAGPKVREEVSAQEKRLVCDTVTEDGELVCETVTEDGEVVCETVTEDGELVCVRQ